MRVERNVHAMILVRLMAVFVIKMEGNVVVNLMLVVSNATDACQISITSLTLDAKVSLVKPYSSYRHPWLLHIKEVVGRLCILPPTHSSNLPLSQLSLSISFAIDTSLLLLFSMGLQ